MATAGGRLEVFFPGQVAGDRDTGLCNIFEGMFGK